MAGCAQFRPSGGHSRRQCTRSLTDVSNDRTNADGYSRRGDHSNAYQSGRFKSGMVRSSATRGVHMGVIRKTLSLSTVGLIDFRSDKERTARSTRQTAKATKQQTKLLQHQLEAQHQASIHAQTLAAQEVLVQQQIGRQAHVAAVTSAVQRQALLSQAAQSERTQAVVAAAPSLAERIVALDNLLAQRLISSEEHADRKQAILDSI